MASIKVFCGETHAKGAKVLDDPNLAVKVAFELDSLWSGLDPLEVLYTEEKKRRRLATSLHAGAQICEFALRQCEPTLTPKHAHGLREQHLQLLADAIWQEYELGTGTPQMAAQLAENRRVITNELLPDQAEGERRNLEYLRMTSELGEAALRMAYGETSDILLSPVLGYLDRAAWLLKGDKRRQSVKQEVALLTYLSLRVARWHLDPEQIAYVRPALRRERGEKKRGAFAVVERSGSHSQPVEIRRVMNESATSPAVKALFPTAPHWFSEIAPQVVQNCQEVLASTDSITNKRLALASVEKNSDFL